MPTRAFQPHNVDMHSAVLSSISSSASTSAREDPLMSKSSSTRSSGSQGGRGRGRGRGKRPSTPTGATKPGLESDCTSVLQ